MTPEMVPPAPFDVVLKRQELRMYRKPGGELTSSVKQQNCYYALKRKCLIKVIPLKLFYYQTFFETWHNEHS